jgi:hydrogenase small subunit
MAFEPRGPNGQGGFSGVHEGVSQSVMHMFWLSGMSCDGCTVSALGANQPSLEDLILGRVPAMPQVIMHHPMISEESGEEFMDAFRAAADGRLDHPYVLVVEGSIPDDQAFSGGGQFAALGQAGRGGGQPVRFTDWVYQLAPGALATFAIGTCATFGGIPAAAGNITGSMSLMDYLGAGYRSSRGLPVVNIPGCAPIGDNFTEAVGAVFRYLDGISPLPEFDDLGRPEWQFGETVHRHCVKAGYYEEGVFAEDPGDNECLVEIGCWGPVVQCNITERGAVNHHGGCMVAGGPCIGCTMPGFPDKYSPFHKAPPGSTLSGGISKIYGGGIRRLRRMSMKTGNREPIWDRADHVPSGWARAAGSRGPQDKVIAYFYKKLQYRGSVNHGDRNKKQPQPQSRDILRPKGIDHYDSVDVLGERVKSQEEL